MTYVTARVDLSTQILLTKEEGTSGHHTKIHQIDLTQLKML
jgi:cell division protein FtsL